jgi:glyoxylase-like metal-dependent hydrolase (beta-lactamase superfamily II)
MLAVQSFTFNPVQENTYVIYEGKDACIIDPGCYFGNERRALKEWLHDEQLTPKFLLNTHCHLDHVFGNKFIHDEYGLTLHIHEREKEMLNNAPTAALRWNMPFENYRGDLIFLHAGDTIQIGDNQLIVILAPGHSPGSICFYCKAQHFIVSGDVLFKMSIGRTDLPGGDYQTLIQSIHKEILVLPDETTVYPGHGESTTIGFEKQNNPFVGAK